MKLIERTFYLDKLKDVMGTPDIKVITGVRRSGKSKLLEAFMDYVRQTDTDANIIHVNYSLSEYEPLLEYHKLNEYKKEIDFVAIKRSEKLYIQVANTIDNPDTFEREVSSLLKIADAYPKMIITRTRQEMYQHEGVKIVDVADWLLA